VRDLVSRDEQILEAADLCAESTVIDPKRASHRVDLLSGLKARTSGLVDVVL
jgi:hypothetical protein